MKKLLILGLAVLCGVASAQVNLTTIPQGTTLGGNELILMQQPPMACNGCTVTTTPAAINSYVRSQSPAIPTSQTPSAQVGTSAVTGATGYYMDAGSAPPLNLGITPTWTGLHTFNAGIALNSITSSAGIQMNGATGGAPGSGGINATTLEVNGVPAATTNTGCTSGTFTATIVGLTTTSGGETPTTGSMAYYICGYTVYIYTTAPSGIGGYWSGSGQLEIEGLPSAIQPAGALAHQGVNCPGTGTISYQAGAEPTAFSAVVADYISGSEAVQLVPSAAFFSGSPALPAVATWWETTSALGQLPEGFSCSWIL